MSEPAAPTCRRCGATADASWCEITGFGDPEPRYVLGHSVCPTTGCVDEFGRRFVPSPDEPGHLTYDDRLWLERHQRLSSELARLTRILMEATHYREEWAP